MIVAAAVRVGGAKGTVHAVPAPGRHGDVMRAMEGAGVPRGPVEQGFIDASEGFVSRARAYAIAVRDGQVRAQGPHGALTSEDVWDEAGEAPQPAREHGRAIAARAAPEQMRRALRAARHILGPGLGPETSLEGGGALVLAWGHRTEDEIALAVRAEAWSATEADPGALEGIARRAERAGASACAVHDGGAAWTLEGRRCTVRARPRGLARRWPGGWVALDARWMRTQHPVEVLRAMWLGLDGHARWSTLYDIACAREARAGTDRDAPSCHDAVWATLDARRRVKCEGALERAVRRVRARSATPDVGGAAHGWDARAIVARARGRRE